MPKLNYPHETHTGDTKAILAIRNKTSDTKLRVSCSRFHERIKRCRNTAKHRNFSPFCTLSFIWTFSGTPVLSTFQGIKKDDSGLYPFCRLVNLEAPSRFELENKGFADPCLTAWLWCRINNDR